ncbi:UNVERIFIED_CONTAM: sulfonate ABC transporter permease [Euhalothece sp. KZN 001]
MTAQEDYQSEIKFSLVIPTYQESQTISSLIASVTDCLDQVLFQQYEVIIVDDNSPDLTWEIAEKLQKCYPQLQVICRQGKRGLSTAVLDGWKVAKGDVLGVIDADLQHPPQVLKQLWQEIEKGADLAIATRYKKGGKVEHWSVTRQVLSKGAHWLGLIFIPDVISGVSDPMSGYFLVRRCCLEYSFLRPVGYKILLEVLGKGRIEKVAEVGYCFQARLRGKSKVSYQQSLDYLHHLFRLRLALFPTQKFFRFAIVGILGIGVDLGSFWLLQQFNFNLTSSAILSTEIAIIHNFFWNDRWTFHEITQTQKQLKQQLRRGLSFNIICGAGLVINGLIVGGLSEQFGVNQYLAKLSAILLVMLWNFYLNLKFSWQWKPKNSKFS